MYRQHNNRKYSYTYLCNVHVFMFTQKQLIDKNQIAYNKFPVFIFSISLITYTKTLYLFVVIKHDC